MRFPKGMILSPEMPVCPYCGDPAERAKASDVVGRRVTGNVFVCRSCEAWAGTTHGKRARLADAQCRHMRQAAHREFDPIWKGGNLCRKHAYKWLSKKLGIPKNDCHMGMFDAETCKRVIDSSREFRGLPKTNLLERIRQRKEKANGNT